MLTCFIANPTKALIVCPSHRKALWCSGKTESDGLRWLHPDSSLLSRRFPPRALACMPQSALCHFLVRCYRLIKLAEFQLLDLHANPQMVIQDVRPRGVRSPSAPALPNLLPGNTCSSFACQRRQASPTNEKTQLQHAHFNPSVVKLVSFAR